jgi:hypothetical protein
VYRGPVAYVDRATETVFYVESDGRHVSAVRLDGTVLWTRDLYSDVKKVIWSRDQSENDAKFDRLLRGDVRDRKIASIARAESADQAQVCLSVAFTSGDVGVVDATSGTFISLGRD